MSPPAPVEILILGAGWTSTFLIPLCEKQGISYAATTRAGSSLPGGYKSIPFAFDPELVDDEEGERLFAALPDARTVLITFPIKVKDASGRLVQWYMKTRIASAGVEKKTVLFVQLGSTGIWDGAPTLTATDAKSEPTIWFDRHSPFNTANERAAAETELLALSSAEAPTTVLDLCGLWGGQRSMRNYLGRLAGTKELLKNKGNIHMIHGLDVSRAILAAHAAPSTAAGERWLLTDLHSHDWWDLASAWGTDEQRGWVRELMREGGVRSLPRSPEQIGRGLDSREFWEAFGIAPEVVRLE